MLQYLTGNLLDAKAEALVNTVNTVGVMGKGIALQFKEAFPVNYKVYRDVCKSGNLKPGNLLVVKDHNAIIGERYIINFPTKVHWKQPSRYEYIEEGLKELVNVINKYEIKSIALPPLGCGNGGLEWIIVKPMIERYLSDLEVDIFVFEPNEAVKEILQKQTFKKDVKLTPARAMLLYALFYYESMGEYSSLFSANKLAYFLQKLGEKLRLNFVPNLYGPYSQQIGHVLYNLNGTYLTGYEQKQAKVFEPLYLNYDKFNEVKLFIEKELLPEQRERLEKLIYLIDGFQSELSLEILATVDFIIEQNQDFSLPEVMNAIAEWNDRKRESFRVEYVENALERLRSYSSEFHFNVM